MKARVAFGLVALLLSCTVAPAQPAPAPAKIVLAREVYNLIHANVDPSRFYNPPAAQDAQAAARQVQARERMKAMFEKTQPLMREAYAKANAARFSMDELNALKRFYQSPIGTKLATLQPEMAVEVNKAVMPQIIGAMMPPPNVRK